MVCISFEITCRAGFCARPNRIWCIECERLFKMDKFTKIRTNFKISLDFICGIYYNTLAFKNECTSGCGEVWYRAWFGTKRPWVRIPSLRPRRRLALSRKKEIGLYSVLFPFLPLSFAFLFSRDVTARNNVAFRSASLTSLCSDESNFVPLLHFFVNDLFNASRP